MTAEIRSPFTNLQMEMIQLFSKEIPEPQLLEIRTMIAKYLLEKARDVNSWVIISNHDTKETRALYQGALIQQFDVARRISCDINSRLPVGELLAIYAPHKMPLL